MSGCRRSRKSHNVQRRPRQRTLRAPTTPNVFLPETVFRYGLREQAVVVVGVKTDSIQRLALSETKGLVIGFKKRIRCS